MNWDKSTPSDIINNIYILSDKLIHMPIIPSYVFHSKKQLAYLLKIGFYKLNDMQWTSDDSKHEIMTIIQHL